jgi:uncharacterized protein Yka (UPF0111/DUF47 family)
MEEETRKMSGLSLEELKEIRDSLRELDPDVEKFSWGPSHSLANERKRKALRKLNREIQRIEKDAKRS